ncbi:MAG: hypothetical protein WB998_08475 [Solirubrobacteraceae bacterium]
MRRLRMYKGTLLGLAVMTSASLATPLASQASKGTPAPKPPSASTGGTAQLSYSSATLNATINPHGSETTYYFQYGATTAYGAQTATVAVGGGAVSVPVSQAISGLATGVTYHYRVVAGSSSGTTTGRDRAFTTRSVPLKFELPRTPRLTLFGTPVSITGSLTGSAAAGHEVVLQANQFPFVGGFVNVGTPQATNSAGQFAFQVAGLSQNTQIRVATLDPRPIRSPVVTVRVGVRVTLHAHKTARKGYVRLYGTVNPAVAGAPVAFQLLRAGRGPLTVGGTVVKKGSATSASFSAVIFIPHNHGGLYRAFVKVSDNSHAPGSSRGVIVHSAPAQRKHR